MNDWGRSVLEQYPVTVYGVKKGRGVLILDTDRGCKILQEYRGSKRHMEAEDRILSFLKEERGLLVDAYVRTKEGELSALNEDGVQYILKDGFLFTECNVGSRGELETAVRMLAKLHMLLRGMDSREIPDRTGLVGNSLVDEMEKHNRELKRIRAAVRMLAKLHMLLRGMDSREIPDRTGLVGNSLVDEMEKHNRELKRIRAFIRNKKKKTGFELCIMKSFDTMYAQAEEALHLLYDSQYQKLYKDAVGQGHICHGSYNQHNVLLHSGQVAVINFQHISIQMQIFDLYQFMRKILEKHNWSLELGSMMLEDYNRILPISKEESRILRAMFLYPEKYWKQMNFYYSSNKAWIPQRNIDKLKHAADQYTVRTAFLNHVL